MRKIDAIEQIAQTRGIPRNQVETILNDFFGMARNALEKGERVDIRNFGNFKVVKRKEKIARDINRKRSIVVPAHYLPTFKPSEKLKQRVKENLSV